MKEFSEKINDDLKLTEISVTKIVDFNGATNLGADSAWVAIYNKKQPSHSFSLQLRINFSYPYISYGLYEHHSADQFLTKQEVTIDKFSYTEMLEFLKESRKRIIDDGNPINIWKLSPGVGAIYWDEMKAKGIASIGLGDHDDSGSMISPQVTKFKPNYFNEHTGSAEMISLLSKAKKGDVVYAFKGRREIIGRGSVQARSQYSKEPLIYGTDHHNYLVVNWEGNFLEGKRLKRMASTDSFANISGLRQELASI